MFRAIPIACVAIACLLTTYTKTNAQDYPTRPITWIVPFPPGGVTDSAARIIAKALTDKLKQPVLIDNRPGAGGVVGTEAVVRSKPDGYTIAYGTAGTIVTNPVLYKNLSFDPRKDLVPVRGLTQSSLVIVINPDRPYKTLAELIAFAKKNPEAINYASPGAGTTPHLSVELFQQMADIKLNHIPYKGSMPALTDVIAGVVDVMSDFPVTVRPLETAGKIKAIATLAPDRLELMPNVPTISELGYPGAELGSWSGVFVPKDTPPDVVAKLSSAFEQALKDPAVVKYSTDNATVLLTDMSSAQFSAFLDTEMVKWKKLIESSGAKPF